MNKDMDSAKSKIRVFIAIIPGAGALNKLSEHVAKLKKEDWGKDVRWLPKKNCHVTLRFVGAIQPIKIPELLGGLRKNTEAFSCFDFTLSRIALFPSPSKPRIIAVEIAPSGLLSQLAEQVDAATVSLGFEPEKRKYKGHITIGRCKKTFQRKQFVEKSLPGLKNPVNEIVLMKSELRQGGVVYSSLGIVPLSRDKQL